MVLALVQEISRSFRKAHMLVSAHAGREIDHMSFDVHLLAVSGQGIPRVLNILSTVLEEKLILSGAPVTEVCFLGGMFFKSKKIT